MRHISFFLTALFLALLTSCASTKQISYFQDARSGGAIAQSVEPVVIKVWPKDKISIIVNSKDPMLANLFNLPLVTKQIGQTASNSNTGSSSQGVSGYTIREDGCIDFPVIGDIYVAGMTREEIAAHIKNELIERNLVKDPVVTVEFMNLTVSVLGEVSHPGRYNIDKDQITLLDASAWQAI